MQRTSSIFPVLRVVRHRWQCAAILLAQVLCLVLDAPGATPEERLIEYQQPPRQLPQDAATLPSLLVDEDGKPIASRQAWQVRRQQIRQTWLKFLGPLKCEKPASKFEVLATERLDRCVRKQIRYQSEPGEWVEAYLLEPLNLDATSQAPGVVVFHSTDAETIRQPAGLTGKSSLHFGLRLAERGMIALCPRCFLWRMSDGFDAQVADFKRRHSGSRGMAKMLWDAQRAVDVLTEHPAVDAARVGAIGHSLGAKEVLYLAAFDDRVRVAVSSEGGIGCAFSNWDAPWYLGPDAHAFLGDHHELLALIAPRAFLLVGGDSADGDRSWPFIASALPVYRMFETPGRLGLYNHRQGHKVPPEAADRMLDWLADYL